MEGTIHDKIAHNPIYYLREIWYTSFVAYEMNFFGYSEPPTTTTVESGSFIGYRIKHREWVDDEDRLVAIKSHNSIRSDGWDPETDQIHHWLANEIFYW